MTWGAQMARAAGAAMVIAAGVACATQAKTSPDTVFPQVPVALADRRDIALETSYTGRVEAIHTVELRSRVTGLLERVLFSEGTYVERGAPLFKIDPRPFEIALRRAAADVATVDAQLQRAREELQRGERLAASDAVSLEELGRRRAEVVTLESKLAAATAASDDAALSLEFTTVTAPVSGRVGQAQVTQGNLVNGGSGSGTRLAVLHSTDPTYVYFELDPHTAAAAREHRAGWTAKVLTLDGGAPIEGRVDFVDNTVGAQTGTLRVRARLRNEAGRLIPGSVVRVVFRYGTAPGTTVIPDIAVGTDQGSRFALVVGTDGLIQYRPITLGPKTAGGLRAVDDGVSPGEQIVLPGLPGLRPGMKVIPVAGGQR